MLIDPLKPSTGGLGEKISRRKSGSQNTLTNTKVSMAIWATFAWPFCYAFMLNILDMSDN